MDCFGDISKVNINFDNTLNPLITRFTKSQTNVTQVLVSESPNLVASYETTDGLNPYESWTFPQLNRLFSPVISHKDSKDGEEYLMAIQEPNSLTNWSFGDNKKRTGKYFFNTKMIALIGFDVENNGQKYIEPIVVFEYGFCQLMSNALQTRREEEKPTIIANDERIVFIDGLFESQFNDNIIIYLITNIRFDPKFDSNAAKIKSVYKLTLTSGVVVQTDRQSVVNSYNNWTVCRKTASVLAINRSDDGLVVYTLNGKMETQLIKLTSSSIELPISLSTTTAGSVCLIGKTKDSNYLMELWESRYGLKLGEINIPSEPLTNDCKVIDNNIWMTCLNGIVLVPIRIESISLSQIVGKIKAQDMEQDFDLKKQFEKFYEDFEANDGKSVDDISERFTTIVKQINGNVPEEVILKLVISCSAKLIQNNSESLKSYFEKLVSLPFNEVFMISRLKSSQLKCEQILLILRLLTELLSSKTIAIIDWISILIDSHINQLILNASEETVKVMEEIDDKINSFGEFYEHLGQIKTLVDIVINSSRSDGISSLKSGFSAPTPKRGQYSIEMLKF